MLSDVSRRAMKQMQHQIDSAQKALSLAERGLKAWEKNIFWHEVLELKAIGARITQEAERLEGALSRCPPY